MRPRVAGSAAAGLALGALARDLPIKLAIVLVAPGKTASCEADQAVSCAMDNLGQMVELVFIVIAICAALAVLGAVALGLGVHRLRPRQQQPDQSVPGDAPSSNLERSDRAGLSLIGIAACLLVPGAWLLGSFLVFLAR